MVIVLRVYLLLVNNSLMGGVIMDTICNSCLFNTGCSFVKLTPNSIIKCRSHIDINLSKEELTKAMDRYMADPIALTMDDIGVEGGNYA